MKRFERLSVLLWTAFLVESTAWMQQIQRQSHCWGVKLPLKLASFGSRRDLPKATDEATKGLTSIQTDLEHRGGEWNESNVDSNLSCAMRQFPQATLRCQGIRGRSIRLHQGRGTNVTFSQAAEKESKLVDLEPDFVFGREPVNLKLGLHYMERKLVNLKPSLNFVVKKLVDLELSFDFEEYEGWWHRRLLPKA